MSWYYQLPNPLGVTGPYVLRGKRPYIDPATPFISNGKPGIVVIESTTHNLGDFIGNLTLHYGTEQYPQTITANKVGSYAVPAPAAGNKVVALISGVPSGANVLVKYFQFI